MSVKLPVTAILSLCASIGLSACQGEGVESQVDTSTAAQTTQDKPAKNAKNATAGSDFTMAESGWLTVGADGAVQTTFFEPDGRYRDLRNGALIAQGRWERRNDGMLCFEPDSGIGACWETGPVNDAGEAIATDTTGKRITIRRIAYLAPAASADDAETGD